MTTAAEGRPYPRWPWAIPPAPGDLRIVQAFVNTLDLEAGVDELESASGLSRWLIRWGLLERGQTVCDAEWRQGLDLREGLRDLLLANNGEASDPTRAAGLQRALGDIALRCSLAVDGGFELVAVGRGWPATAARILTVVTRAVADGSWRRLKACRCSECRWIFYDSSKNRSARWCAMTRCGDVMKARAYRQRRRRRTGSSARGGR